MKLERIEVKEGQFGPYTVFSAGGDSYSAFGRNHSAMAGKRVGDEVDFTWEQKGNFKRVTSFNAPGVSTVQSPQNNAPYKASGGPGPSSRATEFNVMMATRYALDAIIGNAASTPAEAVALVRSIYDGFIEEKKEVVKESL